MLKTLSVDFGGSTVDTLVFDGEEIVFNNSFHQLASKPSHTILQHVLDSYDQDFHKIVVTGGRSHLLGSLLKGNSLWHINEIEAIGMGGLTLGNCKEAIVVSLGTGVAIVHSDGITTTHLGGTPIGGGTLMGLSQLILRDNVDFEILEKMEKVGDKTRVDLSVMDIVGKAIGNLEPEFTASHFGKVSRNMPYTSEDLVSAVFGMIAKNAANIVCHVAAVYENLPIIGIGRLGTSEAMQVHMNTTASKFQRSIIFPDFGEYGVALGAKKVQSKM